jgi:hypothetical protein
VLAAENIVHIAARDGFHSEVHYETRQDSLVLEFNPSAVITKGNLSSAITQRRCSRVPYDGKKTPYHRKKVCCLPQAVTT